MTKLEMGLVSCAVTSQWDLARRLGEFPDDKCRPDVDSKPEDYALWRAIAQWQALGALDEQGQKFLQQALEGKPARAKTEAKLLEAELSGDDAARVAAFDSYMKFFIKRIFPGLDLTDKQAKTGTIFWHWWRRNGLDVDPEGKWRDYIIRLG